MDLRFPGQWFQAESGLHQNWMRDYDPTTVRYLQADPLGILDDPNVYGYARQNPGRYVDPRGEEVTINLGLAGPWWEGLRQNPNCSCPTIPVQPNDCPLDENIDESFWRLNPFWFYNKVRNKGPWDYKQHGKQYQDFGNFNYGATGAAFGFGPIFSVSILLRQAGIAQIAAGTSVPEWGTPNNGPPYGDDPEDQRQIRAGINYYRCSCGGKK